MARPWRPPSIPQWEGNITLNNVTFYFLLGSPKSTYYRVKLQIFAIYASVSLSFLISPFSFSSISIKSIEIIKNFSSWACAIYK